MFGLSQMTLHSQYWLNALIIYSALLSVLDKSTPMKL